MRNEFQRIIDRTLFSEREDNNPFLVPVCNQRRTTLGNRHRIDTRKKTLKSSKKKGSNALGNNLENDHWNFDLNKIDDRRWLKFFLSSLCQWWLRLYSRRYFTSVYVRENNGSRPLVVLSSILCRSCPINQIQRLQISLFNMEWKRTIYLRPIIVIIIKIFLYRCCLCWSVSLLKTFSWFE